MIYATSDLHVKPFNVDYPALLSYWSPPLLYDLFIDWRTSVHEKDLVIVVGDVIDCKDSLRWYSSLRQLFESLPGTILVLPGNHDNNRKAGVLGSLLMRSSEGAWRALRGYSLRWDGYLVIGGCGLTKPLEKASLAHQEAWGSYLRKLHRKYKEAVTLKLQPLFATHFPLVTSSYNPVTALQSKGNKHLLGRPEGVDYKAPILLCGHLHGEGAKKYKEFAHGLRPTYSVEICSVDANGFKLVRVR